MAKRIVFISYRREGGSELARNIRDSLEKRGFKVFFDVEDLIKGPFPQHIYNNIEASADLIAVLTPGSLERCKIEDDWVRKEIAYAIKLGKNIVPILHRSFQWPENLPPDIKQLRDYHGLSSSQEFYEASMDKLANLLSGQKPPWKKWFKGTLLATIAIVIIFFFFPWPADDICDQYLCLGFPEKSVGTLLSEKPYDLKLDIENRTSTDMFVSDVQVKKYNPEAAEFLGLGNELIHVGKFHGPMHIDPHEKKTIIIAGNEILPLKAEISILHNLSGEASEFKVILPNELQEMPAPRVLPKKAIRIGIDGLIPIQKCLADAKKWSSDSHIIAAFPGENKELLEPISRLKILNVRSWVVTSFSVKKEKYFTAIIQDDKIIDKKVYPDKNGSNTDRYPTPVPRFGNQIILELLNEKHLICGNWKSLRLSSVKVGSEWSLAWFLPYRGPDSLPLIVDAVTGDLLSMKAKTGSFSRNSNLILNKENRKPGFRS